jgi:hypothetical protein
LSRASHLERHIIPRNPEIYTSFPILWIIKQKHLKDTTPLGFEAKYGHLPGTPSHDFLQKVRGYVDGVTWLLRETTMKEILLISRGVKGEISFI